MLLTKYTPLGAVVLTGMAGCQTYEARPLDLPAHVEAWTARSVDAEPVRAFAARLAAGGDDDARPAFDPSDGLSLDEAELVALVFNPDLRIARARAGVAEAGAAYAGLWDDPVLEGDLLRILASVDDPWIMRLGIGLTLPVSGRLAVEKARADAKVAAELDRIAEQEWAVGRSLHNAWLAWSAARLEVEETVRLVARLESIAASTARLAEVGEMSRTEATLFTLELIGRQGDLRRLTGAVDDREQALRAVLGLSPGAPLDAEADVHFAPPDVDAGPARLAGANPTLARLRADYEVAEQTLRREIRKQYPDVTIGPVYELEEGQSRIGLGFGLPLPVINANRRGIAEAEAERDLARAAFETEYERLRGQLERASIRRATARAEQDLVEETLVPLVDRQVDDAQRLLALGEGTSGLVLLESLVRAHEAKIQLIDLYLAGSLAASEIAFLLGPEPAPPAAPRDEDAPAKEAAP